MYPMPSMLLRVTPDCIAFPLSLRVAHCLVLPQGNRSRKALFFPAAGDIAREGLHMPFNMLSVRSCQQTVKSHGNSWSRGKSWDCMTCGFTKGIHLNAEL